MTTESKPTSVQKLIVQARADIKRQELDYDFVLDLVIYEDVLNALERLEEQYEDLKQHDERLAELNFEMAERLDVLEGMKEQLQAALDREAGMSDAYEDASASASGYRADRDRLKEQIESDAYYKLWKDENAKVIELVEQLETTREERDLFYDRLKESREQLTALRATVQKELDFMDAFPAVEDGSPIALVIETLRLALASSPASRQEES